MSHGSDIGVQYQEIVYKKLVALCTVGDRSVCVDSEFFLWYVILHEMSDKRIWKNHSLLDEHAIVM